MLSPFHGYLLCIALIGIVWLYMFARRGAVHALGSTMVLCLIFPTWLKVEVNDIPFSVRTATALWNMLYFAISPRQFHPQGKILRPLTVLDVCIALIVLTHIVSDSFATGFRIATPVLAYGEWALPFVAGRFAVNCRNDLRVIAEWAVCTMAFLGGMACIESLTNTNLFEILFGNRPTGLAPRDATRWGLKRAFGPTIHPIFLGMLIVTLMPWSTFILDLSKRPRTRGLVVLSGVLALMGIALTGSRTPIFTLLGSCLLLLALRLRILRVPFGIVLSLAIAIFATFPEETIVKLSQWTGGFERGRLMEVDGEAIVTSSSLTRLHLFSIYADAMIDAGPFGYGSDATSVFPLRIPSLEGSFKDANLFVTVDNAYILWTLRFGWVGCCCLLLLLLASFATAFSFHLKMSGQLFPGSISSLIVSVSCFSLLFVFMHYDFGFTLLWSFGLLSGMASSKTCNLYPRD